MKWFRVGPGRYETAPYDTWLIRSICGRWLLSCAGEQYGCYDRLADAKKAANDLSARALADAAERAAAVANAEWAAHRASRSA